MIPFCAGRVAGGLDQLGSRSDDPEDAAALGRLGITPEDKALNARRLLRLRRELTTERVTSTSGG